MVTVAFSTVAYHVSKYSTTTTTTADLKVGTGTMAFLVLNHWWETGIAVWHSERIDDKWHHLLWCLFAIYKGRANSGWHIIRRTPCVSTDDDAFDSIWKIK